MPDYTVFVNVRHAVDVAGAASLEEAIAEAMDVYKGNTPSIEIEVYDADGRRLDPETGAVLSSETDSAA